MKRVWEKGKDVCGFTLMEMIIVIGVIAVLTAFAAPSVMKYHEELMLTELDDSAKAVFMAAQNNLTALYAAASDETSMINEAKAKEIAEGSRLYYVSTDDDTDIRWLLPEGSVEGELLSENSHYLVEFDPASGKVYGVFLCKEKYGKTILNNNIYKTQAGISSHVIAGCRARDLRKQIYGKTDVMLGYYGAESMDTSERFSEDSDLLLLQKPELTLVNAEELVIDIRLKEVKAAEFSKIRLTISVNEEIIYEDKMPDLYDGVMPIRVVLDTLKENTYHTDRFSVVDGIPAIGGRFCELKTTDGTFLSTKPGEDITVTVTVSALTDETAVHPKSAGAYVRTNSLFDRKSGDTVYISYGRHLQNITDYHGDFFCAVQIREIDFADDSNRKGLYSWAETYREAGKIRKFIPLINDEMIYYDGSGLPIRHLTIAEGRYIDGYGTGAGLFAVVTGMYMKQGLLNIVLSDADVRGTEHTGILAGVVSFVQISNCQAENCTGFGGDGEIGGFVGTAMSNSTIKDSLVINSSFTAELSAGGLTGNLESGTVRGNRVIHCTISSGISSGGLAGVMLNGKILSCEAFQCEITSVNDTLETAAGGCVGRLSYNAPWTSPSITDSTVTGGSVTGKGNVGGFIGIMYNGTVSRCSVLGAGNEGSFTINGGINLGGFIGRMCGESPEKSKITSCKVSDLDGGSTGEVKIVPTDQSRHVGDFAGLLEKGTVQS